MNDIITTKRKIGQRGKGKNVTRCVCINCGTEFNSKFSLAKYCSASCKDKYYKKTKPEAIKIYQKRSREKNKDKYIEKSKLWRQEHPQYQKDWYRNRPDFRLKNYKDRSTRKNIIWELSDEYALELMTSPCYYCGEDGLGIDRLDSSKGYVLGNVVPCCGECNTMKMATPLDVFMRKIFKIADRWNNGVS